MSQARKQLADLLADESFISYCKGTSSAAVAQWEAFRNESTANRMLVDTARSEFLELLQTLALADLDEQEAKLAGKMAINKPATILPLTPSSHRPGKLRYLRWVAVLLPFMAISAGIYYYTSSKPLVYTTRPGERKHFHLPDGSFVRLNADSRLVLPDHFGGKNRDLLLEGEAFFDVHHDSLHPFIVHTPNMDVKAVGTAFNVKSYPSDQATETVLVQGIVEVLLKSATNRKILLQPNQKIKWDKKSGTPTAMINAPDSLLIQHLAGTSTGDIPETGWINDKLIFENTTLSDIAPMLERRYGVEIRIEEKSLEQYRFTGTFEKESLTDVLNICKESRDFSYQIIPGEMPTVRIYK